MHTERSVHTTLVMYLQLPEECGCIEHQDVGSVWVALTLRLENKWTQCLVVSWVHGPQSVKTLACNRNSSPWLPTMDYIKIAAISPVNKETPC